MQFERNWHRLVFGLCLTGCIFLNGCSTPRIQRDGPPPYEVDVSKIPDATPKVEAMSKYGNMPSYRVYGKYYYTLKSSKNYHERGLASWYGTKFHAQKTSSGEAYNMLSMTAAHKTLPLPTYVQVTNLSNNKKVIVKVNDRGPFASSRIIDLSYVAAKKLGIVGHGTAMVDVKAISSVSDELPIVVHNNQPTPGAIQAAKPHYVYLQVGAYKNRHYAENMKSRLKPLVSSPIRITQLTKTSQKLYHVQIGPIKDVVTVNHISRRLKANGINSEKSFV